MGSIEQDELMKDVLGEGQKVGRGSCFFKREFFGDKGWPCGAYFPAVGPNGQLTYEKMNYPNQGETGLIFGVQLGGVCFSIEVNAEGFQKLTNIKHLLVGAEPTSISCEAGTLVLSPGNMKMHGKHGAVWAFVQGPSVASTVPQFQKLNSLKYTHNHSLKYTQYTHNQSVSYKEDELKLPGEEEDMVTGYWGRHQSQRIFKTGVCVSMFEMGADGNTLEKLSKGQENLLKLFKVNQLEVSLDLSKKIPKKPNSVFLNMFAQHPELNDGQKIMLFASPLMAGPPPHILQKGVIPGNHCLKDLMSLPWLYELRDKIEKLVMPLVDFAVHLETCVTASKWKKDVTRDIPRSMLGLVQAMARLYKSQDKQSVEYLLSLVKTSVTNQEGEAWQSSGLLFEPDPKAQALIEGKNPKEVLTGSEDESEDDSDKDSGKKAKNKRGKSSRSKRHASPARSTRSSTRSSRSSDGSSLGKKQKKDKSNASKWRSLVEMVDSSDAENSLASGGDDSDGSSLGKKQKKDKSNASKRRSLVEMVDSSDAEDSLASGDDDSDSN